MACFIVPLVQAVATTVYRKRHAAEIAAPDAPVLRHRLPDLEKMLWGGTLMLIVDHVINGELTWRFPFFTALNELEGAQVMLREILVVGVPMAAVLTAAWIVWAILKESRKPLNQTN